MAVKDIEFLRSELPDVFDDHPMPPGWDDEWLIIPIQHPEAAYVEPASDKEPALEEALCADPNELTAVPNAPLGRDGRDIADLWGGARFPGAPSGTGDGRFSPPPDAFAFHLPYHYYYTTWWGIYIVAEYAAEFAREIHDRSRGRLTVAESMTISRIFLYAHEAFHHIVESFATRLEVTHRQPLYRLGFERIFQRTFGTDDCVEEALATAHALHRVRERAFPRDRKRTDAAMQVLQEIVKSYPPGYRRATEFESDQSFDSGRFQFAEENHCEALHVAPKCPRLWANFPHAFSGIGRVTSRVNYLVHRDSTFASRLQLNLRCLTYGDLSKKLVRIAGCRKVREGKGSHEIWQAPSGQRFPVPRHPRDLADGTLAKIVKEAGLAVSVSQFMQLRP